MTNKNKNIILLDVDGTIAESGNIINEDISLLLNKLQKEKLFEIGIVGGGKFNKILFQLNNKIVVEHIFSECGSIYNKLNTENNQNEIKKNTYESHESYDLIYKKNIRNFKYYNEINILIKIFLNYLSNVEYLLAGNFVDLRDGLIYLSFVGMVANEDERQNFIKLDKKNNYRLELLEILQKKAIELNIDKYVDILLGGSAGIAIYPTQWNKVQIINDEIITKKNYNKIYYFGDKYDIYGNDYKLLNHSDVIGVKIDSLDDTIRELTCIFFEYSSSENNQ
jgi:hydroxymethylpyrimidine pyrophosphatase-like HAD family hydrolase